jgi:hypothetical protein
VSQPPSWKPIHTQSEEFERTVDDAGRIDYLAGNLSRERVKTTTLDLYRFRLCTLTSVPKRS